MGRSRAYDEDVVLTGAMHAFRRQGYAAVSIRDLEEATGLKAGSIYNSFGDKAGLFASAFAHYNRAVLRRRIAEHASAAAGLRGLRDLFLSLLREPRGESFGCLITNSAIEFGGEGRPPAGVREGLKVLSETFVERLSSARAAGVLRPESDPNLTAARLLALYQGILVLIRAHHDKAALKRLINSEFDALEEQHGA
ncbi:transcriptional regulator, TetR family [Rhizobiales bacterium GAS188]|nr:transcriptional regulator, TetR family [Rhizobiales bacterium GAS188]